MKSEVIMFQHTEHFESRAAQRNLSVDAIEYILEYGKRIHRAGVLFYFLRDCDIPARDRVYEQITRLAGTAVVVTKDREAIITIWRNRKEGLKNIKRKPRYGCMKPESIS